MIKLNKMHPNKNGKFSGKNRLKNIINPKGIILNPNITRISPVGKSCFKIKLSFPKSLYTGKSFIEVIVKTFFFFKLYF